MEGLFIVRDERVKYIFAIIPKWSYHLLLNIASIYVHDLLICVAIFMLRVCSDSSINLFRFSLKTNIFCIAYEYNLCAGMCYIIIIIIIIAVNLHILLIIIISSNSFCSYCSA